MQNILYKLGTIFSIYCILVIDERVHLIHVTNACNPVSSFVYLVILSIIEHNCCAPFNMSSILCLVRLFISIFFSLTHDREVELMQMKAQLEAQRKDIKRLTAAVTRSGDLYELKLI